VDASSAHSKKATRYAFILESLATVKSCIILTELMQQGCDGAEEQMCELFDCLLTSVRSDQPMTVKQFMQSAPPSIVLVFKRKK
jgi:hypothetical protein